MRTPQPPVAVAISFVDRINRADTAGLSTLMSADHELRVFDEEPVIGRAANAEAWAAYFADFPDYVLYPRTLAADGQMVAILGHTTGSHLGLDDDAEARLTLIWLVRARDGEVLSWTPLEDTPAHRSAYGLGR
ncbi:nuclear transport factor 2 family protein [Actinomadura scrupuli]|uniref:nuclear transport factor 2 family protein n=1 Tax=Actinomadura scrupuli TaxID=559629 RepID=UPI003D977148